MFDWFGLVCFANKTKNVSRHTADSKPVKQEVNGTVILPPLVFPAAATCPPCVRESDRDFISFYLILSHFISFYLILSHFISFYLILSHFISCYLISSHFISFYPILSHFISFYLILSHFISFYLIYNPPYFQSLLLLTLWK